MLDIKKLDKKFDEILSSFTEERIQEWVDYKENMINKETLLGAALGIIRIPVDEFMVHIDISQKQLRFEVYPIEHWTHLGTNVKGMSYIDKEDSSEHREEFEEGKCLKKLEGSFCWRGVWEERLYFTDNEYWGEDIEELSRLYNDIIVPWCKGFIKEREPNRQYDE